MTESSTPEPSSNAGSEQNKAALAQPNVGATQLDMTPPMPQSPQRSGSNFVSIFAMLIALGALAASAFTWYQNQVVRVEQESKLSVGVSEIGSQVSRLGDSVARLKSDQNVVINQAQLSSATLELESRFLSEIRGLSDQQQALAEAVRKINSDRQQGVNQYVIDESAQLLRLANNSVLFSNDVNSAINALSLADAQLKSLIDPRYSAVRSQILREIGALQSVQLPDLEALSTRLQTVSALVTSLPLANEPENLKVDAESVLAEQPISWRTELKKVWQDMLNSVQIQRVDQPPKPLLAPEQRYFLDQNLILTIEKAELAMVQNRPSVYKGAIEGAVIWLTEYFDLSNSQVNSVVAELNQLAEQPLDSAMPDISGSYQLLQSIQGGQ